MSTLLTIIGYVVGSWGVGFGFGFLLCMYRRFMEQM